jgi:geranylgeranyl diphosphate synthase type I
MMSSDPSSRALSKSEPVSGAGSGAGTEFMTLLERFRSRLVAELNDWLTAKESVAVRTAAETVELTGSLREFVAREGKRLRPALVEYAYRACGAEDEAALPMAMAVEMLHTYLLVHDDIMDRAEVRRGAPTVHRLFREHHRREGWTGDADRHGESVAILMGDLAHSYAVDLFLSTRIAPERRAGVTSCFAEMCQEVVIGQYLEITAPHRADLGEEDLLNILRLKSGRYSVERPIQLGSLLAGASSEVLGSLSRYGFAIGEAFQLQDDVLGVFGDRKAVGKPVGGDLEEGKFTLLILAALKRARPEEEKLILRCLQEERPGPREVQGVREIIEKVGAKRRIEEMVEERLDKAAQAVDGLEITPEGEVFFSGLIEYLRERES